MNVRASVSICVCCVYVQVCVIILSYRRLRVYYRSIGIQKKICGLFPGQVKNFRTCLRMNFVHTSVRNVMREHAKLLKACCPN